MGVYYRCMETTIWCWFPLCFAHELSTSLKKIIYNPIQRLFHVLKTHSEFQELKEPQLQIYWIFYFQPRSVIRTWSL